MRIECHNHLSQPVVLPVTRVLILDDFDNPLAFAVEQQPGHITIFRIDDDDFHAQLAMHGINKTVVVKGLKPPRG